MSTATVVLDGHQISVSLGESVSHPKIVQTIRRRILDGTASDELVHAYAIMMSGTPAGQSTEER